MMFSLLLHVSLCEKFIDIVGSHPIIHRRAISDGDEWIIKSSFSRTIYSLNSIPDGEEFTLIDGDAERIMIHSASTTFQALTGDNTSLIFRNLTEGTYGVVTMGLGDECSEDVYVSNQNWASNPTKGEERINCPVGRECCLLTAGVPSEKIDIYVYISTLGYLKFIESSGSHSSYPNKENTSVSMRYRRASPIKPLIFLYKGGPMANRSYFQVQYYSTETAELTNEYPITYIKGFSKPIEFVKYIKDPDVSDENNDDLENEPTKKFPAYAIIIPVVLVVVIAIAIGVIVFLIKKKKNGVNGNSHKSSSSS